LRVHDVFERIDQRNPVCAAKAWTYPQLRHALLQDKEIQEKNTGNTGGNLAVLNFFDISITWRSFADGPRYNFIAFAVQIHRTCGTTSSHVSVDKSRFSSVAGAVQIHRGQLDVFHRPSPWQSTAP
jgi:hypothetical protein